MHKRQYAQRKHLVNAVDSLLYQLHTLSFFLSPSILGFVFRIMSQFQCTKPKDIDLSCSLRFHWITVFILNIPNFYMHIVYGAMEGRAIILDFVGMAYTASRLQLITLDFTILFMQWILLTISYETAVANSSSQGEDILLPVEEPSTPLPSGLPTPITSPLPTPSLSRRRRFFSEAASTDYSPIKTATTSTTRTPNASSDDNIIDLRFYPLITRLRHPPPPIMTRTDTDSSSSSAGGAGLPLPNTTSVRIPASLRMLMRSQAALARRSTAEVMAGGELPRRTNNGTIMPTSSTRGARGSVRPEGGVGGGAGAGGGRRENRIPGAIDTDDP